MASEASYEQGLLNLPARWMGLTLVKSLWKGCPQQAISVGFPLGLGLCLVWYYGPVMWDSILRHDGAFCRMIVVTV